MCIHSTSYKERIVHLKLNILIIYWLDWYSSHLTSYCAGRVLIIFPSHHSNKVNVHQVRLPLTVSIHSLLLEIWDLYHRKKMNCSTVSYRYRLASFVYNLKDNNTAQKIVIAPWIKKTKQKTRTNNANKQYSLFSS